MQKRVVEPQADETRTESKVARAEPSRGAPEAASKYWIVEWRFRSTQKDYDWQPISRSPFGSELAAKNYHQREGFEYRILEYAPKESAQEYRCNICGDHMKHGAQDETVIHFVPCECWRGNGGHVVLLEALRHAHLYFLQSNDLTVDDREMLDEMWAAIKQAEQT